MNKSAATILRGLAMAAAFVLAAASLAAADQGHGLAFGEPGKVSQVSRTMTITMRDVSYQPKTIMVRSGETIRFVLKNTGGLLHEFNLGTPEMHAAHRKEMAEMLKSGMITATGINHAMMHMDHSSMDPSKTGMKMPMLHDDPNSVLVEPGKTAELVWKFTKVATLQFSCNIPAHPEAGMVGQVRFAR